MFVYRLWVQIGCVTQPRKPTLDKGNKVATVIRNKKGGLNRLKGLGTAFLRGNLGVRQPVFGEFNSRAGNI